MDYEKPDRADIILALWDNAPEFVAVVDEFRRLAKETDNPFVNEFLNFIGDGLMKDAVKPDEAAPYLQPIGVKSIERIQTFKLEGRPASVWFTNSFRDRLQFLRTGQLTVQYLKAELIVPLTLRLDTAKFVKCENK